MRTTVVCSVRDEGPYLVEWVAWYRMLGFTDILVVSNDCTDRSPELLDALARAGWVRHLVCDVPDGRQITGRKLRAAHATPEVRGADWVLVCDVDEFLVIHRGAGRIADLIGPAPDFLGMSVNWRVFGSSGLMRWEDGLTHRQFLRAAPTGHPVSRWVKSVAAHADWFATLGEHGPKRFDPARAGVPWGGPGMRWVNSEGAEVPDWRPGAEYLRLLPQHLTTHRVAQMNHYMVRSAEAFGLKRGTRAPVSGVDRYTDDYIRRYDRNEIVDASALADAAAFDAVHAAAMALPEVARLHHLCCADYVRRLAARAGRDAGDDPRLAFHLSQAGA